METSCYLFPIDHFLGSTPPPAIVGKKEICYFLTAVLYFGSQFGNTYLTTILANLISWTLQRVYMAVADCSLCKRKEKGTNLKKKTAFATST